MKARVVTYLFLLVWAPASAAQGGGDAASGSKLYLQDGWMLQSSVRVQAKGEVLSTTKFAPEQWYRTTVPATVLAALVENKVFPDPYFGTNLRSIPGASYPIGENFSNLPMPEDSPFRRSWWYRKEFRLPSSYKGKRVWLHFSGINYRANIWLNGRQIARSTDVAGAFREYEFEVSGLALPGAANILAVEVFAPQPDDLAITWVDWNPAPPDKNMGLWREVYLRASGPIALRYAHVTTRLDSTSGNAALLTVTAEVRNASGRKVTGTVKGRIENVEFRQTVELDAGETRLVRFAPDQSAQLKFAHPRLWWPAQMGNPHLYELTMEAESSGQISDREVVRFGIREVTSELNEKGARVFKINGKPIFIRGGGWTPDMLLRPTPKRDEAQLRYVLDLGLNTIRLEGKLEPEHLFDLTDRYGILVMAGWCCCDHWEHWDKWKKEDHVIAAESQKSQIRRLRNRPSVFVWLNASDGPPPPDVERMYVDILKTLEWPNPYLSSAVQKPTAVTGPTGVKMTGPYEWVPPSYWLLDTTRGGAWSFNTETSPGPAVPPVQTLRKMLPADRLWPVNEHWNFHAGGGQFKNLAVFTNALNARYGAATRLDDYVLKAQAMAYEGQRAMFEAYSRNKYASSGIIQWMLNNGWPSLIWHLFDYYLMPGGGYFGTKKACEPLHVQYSYDDRSVAVVNSRHEAFTNLKVKAAVYNLDSTEKFSQQAAVDVAADSTRKVLTIPELQGLTSTYFLRLTLEEASGRLVSSNFYWLPTHSDVLDWEKSTWYYTPTTSYADFTALQTLPRVQLDVSGQRKREGAEEVVRVVVKNPSPHLAFLVHLRLTQGEHGDDVLPIVWDDNYFALLPGETRQIKARYNLADVHERLPIIEVAGWNVMPGRTAAAADLPVRPSPGALNENLQ